MQSALKAHQDQDYRAKEGQIFHRRSIERIVDRVWMLVIAVVSYPWLALFLGIEDGFTVTNELKL